MIKIHWMQNEVGMSGQELKLMSDNWDSFNYSSVLLPFHSELPDAWIRSAYALNTNHKFKYMIAFRPYHISPQYFAMMVTGFNKIQPNRLIINLIAGDVHNRTDEDKQMDFYGETKNLLTIEQRKQYVRDFLEKCKKMPLLKNNMPEIILSGLSDFTIETAKQFNSTTLCMYDDYFNNIERLKDCSKKMVSAKIYVRDTMQEAEELSNLVQVPRLKDFTIYGTRDVVIKKMKELIPLGVTDILVGSHTFDNEYNKIHDLVKSLGGVVTNESN